MNESHCEVCSIWILFYSCYNLHWWCVSKQIFLLWSTFNKELPYLKGRVIIVINLISPCLIIIIKVFIKHKILSIDTQKLKHTGTRTHEHTGYTKQAILIIVKYVHKLKQAAETWARWGQQHGTQNMAGLYYYSLEKCLKILPKERGFLMEKKGKVIPHRGTEDRPVCFPGSYLV